MIPWAARSAEERSLLNPCFCSMLIWHAARAYQSESDRSISLEEAFLVLPIVLHHGTRGRLPRGVRTSLAVWVQENPLIRGRFADRAKALVPYSREALLFAGIRGFLRFDGGRVLADDARAATIAAAA